MDYAPSTADPAGDRQLGKGFTSVRVRHIKEGFALAQKYSVFSRFVVTGCVAALGLSAIAYANDDETPTTRQIAFAKTVSDLMLNELVAALFQEFDETTPQNVEHGKQAISLIFNDVNRDMRLVGAFPPLLGGANDRPADRFETTALRRALDGLTHDSVQRINDTWYYRRSVPLSNTMHQNCVLCHQNFRPELLGNDNTGQWVGALVLGVPIRPTRGH